MAKWSYVCTACHRSPCACKKQPQRIIEQPRGSSNERGYTYRWRKRSKQYLTDNPFCVRCKADGLAVAAALVDHVVPHRGDTDGDVFWDEHNWQALCHKCHNRKTRHEAQAGQRFVVHGKPGSGKTTYVRERRTDTDLVWDFDAVLSALTDDHRRGSTPPHHLIRLMEQMKGAFINFVRTDATNRRVWFISANDATADKIAKTTGATKIKLDGGAKDIPGKKPRPTHPKRAYFSDEI